jgi:hypothetical protein
LLNLAVLPIENDPTIDLRECFRQRLAPENILPRAAPLVRVGEGEIETI